MKKLLCTVLVFVLLAGCSSGSAAVTSSDSTDSSTSTETVDYSKEVAQASKDAATIVKQMGFENISETTEDRIINGLFDFEDGMIYGGSLYRANDTTSTDSVAVFITNDPDGVITYVNQYLADKKSSAEYSSPSELFKLDNAVVVSNDSKVVMIVAQNIEDAKTVAQRIIAE